MADSATDASEENAGASLGSRQRRLLTITLVFTVVVASFETTATQTVISTALDEIGGRALYALAFGAFTLAELIAVVMGAGLVNRFGPVRIFVAGAVLHAAGLVLCGSAPFFAWYVSGRVVQGTGAGLVWLTVYVLVGHCYPDLQRGRVLGFIAMGWAIPGTLGPVVAGTIAVHGSWRLVLLPVPVLEAVALAVVWSVLRYVDRQGYPGTSRGGLGNRVVPSVLLSTGIVAVLSLRELPEALAWPVFGVSLAVIAVACRPLFPVGAFRLAAGLPSAVLVRGLAAAPWVAVGFLVPLSLVESRGLGLTEAGLVLSCGVVGFALGGFLHSRAWTTTVERRWLVLGGLVVQAVGLATTAAGLGTALGLAYAGWALTGLGASFAIIALNATVLSLSIGTAQSESASAMAIAESSSVAVLTAAAGLALASVDASGPGVAVLSQFTMAGCAAGLLLLGAAVRRLQPDHAAEAAA